MSSSSLLTAIEDLLLRRFQLAKPRLGTRHSSRPASAQATSSALAHLQTLVAAEFAHGLADVAVFAVHGVVQPPHVGFGKLSAERAQNIPQLRVELQRLAAHDRHRL